MRLTHGSSLFLAMFVSVLLNVTLLLGQAGAELFPGAAPARSPAQQERERVIMSDGLRSGGAPQRVALAGDRTAYRFSLPGVRWEPCAVIGWRYNPQGGYRGSLRDLKRAFRLVAHASGLRFRFGGTTSRRVAHHRPRDAGTDILVSWETPRTVPALRKNVLGLAYTSYYPSTRRYASGRIALDRTETRVRRGFHAHGRVDWGQVMTHELGHVVGLGHVQQQVQNMSSIANARNHRLGAGDVAGMRRLGPGRRCRDGRAPRR
jgi:hypothetical protein